MTFKSSLWAPHYRFSTATKKCIQLDNNNMLSVELSFQKMSLTIASSLFRKLQRVQARFFMSTAGLYAKHSYLPENVGF